MMLLICLLTILVLVLKFGARWRNRKLIKLSEELKSATPCWPLVGHAYKFIGNGMDHLKAFEHFGREAMSNGGLTSFWIGHMLLVVIVDAADAEFILKHYLEKGFVMNFIRDLIGNGNVVAPVPIWRVRRKILVRMFSMKVLRTFEELFAKNSRIIAERLEPKVGTGPFPIGKYFSAYTMDIVFESTLGENLETDQKSKFVKVIKSGYKLVAERMISPWQHNSTIYKLFPSYYNAEKLKKFTNELMGKTISAKRRESQKEIEINEKVAEKDNKPKSFKSFIEFLMEATIGDRQYTDKEIQEEILVLFLAGSDTTAICLGFTAVMLARYPDIQEQVYKELKEVFGDSTSPLSMTTEDLMKLNLLDAFIKESLRLYCPSPVIARSSDRDLTLPSGVTIASNCLLLVNIWALHRNPKYWGPDAEQFRPERWLDVNFNLKHPAQFMPFSYGPRNCAGYRFGMASMKMLLVTMLRRYRILSDTGPTINGVHKPLRLEFTINSKDYDNFIVKLEERV